MLTTFFALILMFAANPVLVPNSMKPNPVIYRGSSKPAVVPNFWLMGPAAITDTVSVAADTTSSRADSTGAFNAKAQEAR